MFQQYRQRLLSYWQQRDPRERLLIGLAFVFLVITVFYQLYWRPINKSVDLLRLSVPRERAQLAQMRVQAKQVPRIQTSAPTASLMPTLENTIDNHGLREKLHRMEPDGNKLAQVDFKQVGYANLLKWILHLQRQHGIVVKTARLTATATPGIVDANLTLSLGS
jgi:general secretion pathway protein M